MTTLPPLIMTASGQQSARSEKPTERRCWACASKVEDGSKICLKCKNWQGPRHYLGFSSTILSLLIALITVTGVFLPPILRYIAPPPIRLEHRADFDYRCIIEPCASKSAPREGIWKIYVRNIGRSVIHLSRLMICGNPNKTLEEITQNNQCHSTEWCRAVFETEMSTWFAPEDERLLIYSPLDYNLIGEYAPSIVTVCIVPAIEPEKMVVGFEVVDKIFDYQGVKVIEVASQMTEFDELFEDYLSANE